jgi:hypothetical protein
MPDRETTLGQDGEAPTSCRNRTVKYRQAIIKIRVITYYQADIVVRESKTLIGSPLIRKAG